MPFDRSQTVTIIRHGDFETHKVYVEVLIHQAQTDSDPEIKWATLLLLQSMCDLATNEAEENLFMELGTRVRDLYVSMAVGSQETS